MSGSLIVFYSHSANTRKLAKLIQKASGATLAELEPEVAYPNDYNAVVEQAKREIGTGYRPALKALPDVSGYETVFVGSPNWWSTVAPPVATFLEASDLADKTVVPFCTHGGGEFGHMERDIRALCSGATVLPGLSAYGDTATGAHVADWLRRIGLGE